MADEKAPNLFELVGAGEEINYSLSGFDGRSRLRFAELEFVGDEIELATTALGTEVTVTTEEIEDLRTRRLTLLLPVINLRDSRQAEFETLAIETTSESSFGGPGLVPGQVQTYRVIEMHGIAQAVDF